MACYLPCAQDATLSPQSTTLRRPRAHSLSTDTLRHDCSTSTPARDACVRTASDGQHVPMRRVRITYRDDALHKSAVANMHRLVRAAHESEDEAESTTSAALARKALRYRKKLVRARAVDIDDPTFDVAEFMGVTWLLLLWYIKLQSRLN